MARPGQSSSFMNCMYAEERVASTYFLDLQDPPPTPPKKKIAGERKTKQDLCAMQVCYLPITALSTEK